LNEWRCLDNRQSAGFALTADNWVDANDQHAIATLSRIIYNATAGARKGAIRAARCCPGDFATNLFLISL
jgi:hypothetical protein